MEKVKDQVKGQEKEIDKGKVVLKDENVGVVQIADDVVAMIAALAATEVEGVNPPVGSVSGLMTRSGMKKLTKYVRVDVLGGNVIVDLAVTMEYGYNIPVTCQKVQSKVKAAIENMTGLTCSDVNVRIVGVRVKKA